MNYYTVTDERADGRTESDAYEPTMQYAQVGSKIKSWLTVSTMLYVIASWLQKHRPLSGNGNHLLQPEGNCVCCTRLHTKHLILTFYLDPWPWRTHRWMLSSTFISLLHSRQKYMSMTSNAFSLASTQWISNPEKGLNSVKWTDLFVGVFKIQKTKATRPGSKQWCDA